MVTRLSVEDKRLLPGCSAGLAERTAVVDLRHTGDWSVAALLAAPREVTSWTLR